MTENIVVPQSPTTPGVIVSEGGRGNYGLEGKDATFIQTGHFATSHQLLARDIAENRAVYERGNAQAMLATKDNTIEVLKADARRGEQLTAIMAKLDFLESGAKANVDLQAARDEVQLLKIKFSVVP